MNLHEAETLANELMEKHGLVRDGWQFRWNHRRTAFGVCRYTTRQIMLSRPLTALNSVETVRDTILHEIAHALTPGCDHGRLWQLTAASIGAKPKACQSLRDTVSVPGKFTLACADCGLTQQLYRAPSTRKRLFIESGVARHASCTKKANGGKLTLTQN